MSFNIMDSDRMAVPLPLGGTYIMSADGARALRQKENEVFEQNKPILSDLKFDDLQKALVVTVEQNGDLKRAHYKLK